MTRQRHCDRRPHYVRQTHCARRRARNLKEIFETFVVKNNSGYYVCLVTLFSPIVWLNNKCQTTAQPRMHSHYLLSIQNATPCTNRLFSFTSSTDSLMAWREGLGIVGRGRDVSSTSSPVDVWETASVSNQK
jgi:hypothetical protein